MAVNRERKPTEIKDFLPYYIENTIFYNKKIAQNYKNIAYYYNFVIGLYMANLPSSSEKRKKDRLFSFLRCMV